MMLGKIKTLLSAEKMWRELKNKARKDLSAHDVLVDFNGLNNGRKMCQILFQLKAAGFNPCLRLTHFEFLKNKNFNIDYMGKLIFNNFSIENRGKNYKFVMCKSAKKYKRIKTITFDSDMNNFYKRTNERFYFPILMHPYRMSRFEKCQNINISHDLNKIRDIGVLFIGNNGNCYDVGNNLQERFKCYSRTEMINFICNEFKDYVLRPDNISELNKILQTQDVSKKFLIIDKFRVDGELFMDMFKHADFHLWTSGIPYPYCHNHVESIYCGAIPICQDKFYYHGLRNLDNAFIYQNYDDLKQIVYKIINGEIKQETIKNMRKNIYNLYQNYYSYSSYRERIFDFLESDKREEKYYICQGFIR